MFLLYPYNFGQLAPFWRNYVTKNIILAIIFAVTVSATEFVASIYNNTFLTADPYL